MYTFTSRVRFSETDENGKLSLAGIMNYLQDCRCLSLRRCRQWNGYA